MKSIEDIEKLSFEELERLASDESQEVPGSLSAKLKTAVAAAAFAEEQKETRRRKKSRIAALSAAVALAAGLAIVLSVPTRPKDTFSDPALAYAELEKVFAYISSEMDKGLEIAAEAEPALEKPGQIIGKINNR